MDTQNIQDVLAWVRTTDLVEVRWRRGAASVEFRLEEAPQVPPASFPATTLVPVVSPGVGVFRWSAPGKPRLAEEGKDVAAGDILGILDTGGKALEVPAPQAGRLVKLLIEDGKPAEFGQPLFVLRPA